MKTLRFIFISFFIFNFIFNLNSQTIEVSGSIFGNTSWNADTVKIIGDLVIEQDAVLTINPGTYVESQDFFKINISGMILAIGTSSDSIVFTVHDTTNFWYDTTSVAGGWAGFYLVDNNASIDTSVFEFCRIQYAKNFDEYGGDINGGAIYAKDYGSIKVKNSYLNNNMVACETTGIDGPAGGAIYCKNVNYVLIDSNRFEQNRSFDNGGAIHIDKDCNQVLITHNTFIKNSAIKYTIGWISGAGAAIGTTDALNYSPVIANNFCFNNRAVDGAIYSSNKNSFIYNNVICNNFGSGIADGHQLSTNKIFNNTIINNLTFMGGIELYSKAIVYNNICWGNEFYAGQQYDQIFVDPVLSNPELFYNCVQYGDGGDSAINEFPEFVNPSLGVGLEYNGFDANWTLLDWSPCVNKGTPDTTGLSIPSFDIIGNPRIYGNRIEIGAYENQSVGVTTNDHSGSLRKISIFPNPGSNQLNIITNLKDLEFELVNLNGQTIIKESIKNEISSINTESINTGIYFYKLIDKKNNIIEKGKWIRK
jgi:predicted outer membrane repeat protein